VERYMDLFLRGANGWRESERDGRRQELAQFRTREVPPSDGYDVILSLDVAVQNIIERELAYLAQRYSPAKATIIVSDARTGFILGLANHPTFDLNEFNKAPLGALRNIAVTDVLEPGSTFKIVAAGAALEEGLVTPGTIFDCTADQVEYRGRRLTLPRDDHAPAQYTVAGIVSHSSNRGAARLGLLLGERRFYEYARRFDVEGVNFARDAADALGLVQLIPIAGVYAGVRWAYNVHPEDSGRWTLRAGMQLGRTEGARALLPYGTVDVEVEDDTDWSPRAHVQAGVWLPEVGGRRMLRLGVGFMTGPTPLGQFRSERTTQLTLGVSGSP